MSPRPTDAFRAEHAELIEHIEHLRVAAHKLPELSIDERADVLERVLDFLRDHLLPHARAEELVLYPEWARLVGYADAAAPMVHDHVAVAERVDRLARTPVEDVATLQELLYGLHALIGVHFGKEEDIQLAAFDEQPQEFVDEVLARMAEAAGPAHSHH